MRVELSFTKMTDIVIGAIIGAVGIIIGTIISISGNVLSQFIESKLRRRNKLNELIAERQLDACVWIYPLFKKIEAYLTTSEANPNFEKAKRIVLDNEDEFWGKRLLFPGRVHDAWINCKNAVLNQDKDEATKQAHKGYEEVYDSLKVKPFNLDN